MVSWARVRSYADVERFGSKYPIQDHNSYKPQSRRAHNLCAGGENEINKYIPELAVEYKPDFRQKIADSWPFSINDTELEGIGVGTLLTIGIHDYGYDREAFAEVTKRKLQVT